MFNEENRELLNKIIKRNIQIIGIAGIENLAIEEFGELITVIMQLRRHRKCEDDLISEIADVRIMLEQITTLYSIGQRVEDEIKYKLERTKGRLRI